MRKKLHIALLGNAHKEHPAPKGAVFAPGRIATDLADGLVARGHNVDLYAPKGSKTRARLIDFSLPSVYRMYDKNIGLDSAQYTRAFVQIDLLNITNAIQKLNKGTYDIVHTHDIRNAVTLASFAEKPLIHTLHTVIQKKDISPFQKKALQQYKKNNKYITISPRQKSLLDATLFPSFATIPHGIDIGSYTYTHKAGTYALFVGRMTAEKGVHIAIQACKKAQKKLLLVGNIPSDKASHRYWNTQIKPHLSKNVVYEGHKTPKQVRSYFKKAEVVLFPSQVEESFGLVPLEALASGTPVIAYTTGITPILISHGENGFIVSSPKQMAQALSRIDTIDRATCRHSVEQTYSIEHMVAQYEQAYYTLIS